MPTKVLPAPQGRTINPDRALSLIMQFLTALN